MSASCPPSPPSADSQSHPGRTTPRRFHYAAPGGDRAFERTCVEDLFLMLNVEKARRLARDACLEGPRGNMHAAMDISSILQDGMPWDEVVPVIRSAGFAGVNVSTEQVRTREQAVQFLAGVGAQQMAVVSFHGSLDPFFVGLAERSDTSYVTRDFQIADVLSLDPCAPINYDLVAAALPRTEAFQRGRTLADVHRAQRHALAEKGIRTSTDIIASIVAHVAAGRPSGCHRPALFETRQSLMMESPEICAENLDALVGICRTHFVDDREWGLTVDVGHTVGALPRRPGIENLHAMREETERILRVLEAFRAHIRMVHVSGTVTAHTLASYRLAARAGLDPEAVKAWSLHQAIDSPFIVEMVRGIREMMGDQAFVEVSEVRPIHSAAKYFGDTLHFEPAMSERVHLEQIRLQARILGY